MSSVQFLKAFVSERLTAAAEEIFGLFEKTIVQYEEELDRQRRLLDVVWKPDVKLHRIELGKNHVHKEEQDPPDQQLCNQGTNVSLDQEDPGPPQIKQEEDEELHSQEGARLPSNQDTSKAPLTPTTERTGHSQPDSAEHQLLSHSSTLAQHVGDSFTPETRRIHTDKRTFKCDICAKEFQLKSKFQRHLQVHTGEKPYVCSTCGKRFRQASTLKGHIMIHTGEKPYACKICGRPFRNRGHLTVHMRRAHTGEKPYLCKTCGKGFCVTSSLRQHMMVHSGEKPFKCEQCGKRFTRGRALLFHRRSHTGEKPYCCQTCGKRFARRSGLMVHMRTHTGPKIHQSQKKTLQKACKITSS